MAGLRSLWPRSGFSLPPFDLPPLEFETGREAAEELVAAEVVVSLRARPCAVPPERAFPTAGQLSARIEQHLHGSVRTSVPAVDAAAELRQALSQLRNSLGEVTLRR